MLLTGQVFAGVIALAIIFIGVRFLWAPSTAASGYGISAPSTAVTASSPWFAVKGVRDIVSGLFIFLLMTSGSPRLLGEFLLVASLIPIGDAVIVLRAGGKRAVALGIHGATAIFIIVAGAILIGAPL